MSRERVFALIFVVLAWLPSAGWAYVQADGYLIAEAPCPALQSIKKGTNPGDVALTVDMAYPVLGKNRPDASHWHVRVKGASPQERWVAVSCGIHVVVAGSDGGNAGASPAAPSPTGGMAASGEPEYLLALSWQPAFCQTHQSKNECRTQTIGRYDAANLTLHGLWPQPRGREYCDVSARDKALDRSGAWDQLPPLNLPDATYLKLLQRMPGVASQLQRHEWTKHGTCFGTTPEVYFKDAMALQEQINTSPVRELFVTNVGDSLSASEVRTRFDQAFGTGAGNKVNMRCTGNLITELWINLRGKIKADTPLASLLKDAPNAQVGCHEGMVDRVGF